jgi:TonB family protein
VDGRAKECQKLLESLVGLGFGQAGARLGPKFVMSSVDYADYAKPTIFRIPIRFLIDEGRTASPVALPTPGPDESDDTLPPGHIAADWLKRPTSEELKAVWPTRALLDGVGGEAKINCEVDLHGLLQHCRVAYESPPGMGFGAAALLLAPSFLMKPEMGPEGPVLSRVNIPIHFKTGAGWRPSGAFVTKAGAFTMLSQIVWAAAPTFDDLASAYPKAVSGIRGYVALRCQVLANGALRDCETTAENPAGKGFDKAARALINRFRAKLEPGDLKSRGTMRTTIPMAFPDPASAEFKTHHIGAPMWTVGLDPKTVAQVFPYAAAAKGVKTGRGVAQCTVAADGGLADCKPLPGDPDGLGFSQSAVIVAKVMRMNPWTSDGGPVDGAKVIIPIRFNLAPETANPSGKKD